MNVFGIRRSFLFSLAAVTMTGLAADLPSSDGPPANWARFRGSDGNAIYPQSDVPLSCDVKTGANVAWSVEVPAVGFSSPVIWGDRVFLSGGDEKRWGVMCFDVTSGKLLWQSDVPPAVGGTAGKFEVPDQCGMAAGTVATDGRHVYAMFANGDLAAFDFDGKLAWAKNLGIPKNSYGHASSPIPWRDRVIVQFDQGDTDEHLSKLYAFDGATGAMVWQTPRPAGSSWATPIVFEAAGKSQLVALAVPWVISYAANDGSEIWRAEVLDGEVTPSPIFSDGTLFVISPSNKLQTIRPDGHGDVSKSHLGWEVEDGVPDVPSPVSDGELVFVVDSSGVLTCYDARDGSKQWNHDFGEEFSASPSIAGHHVYLVTRKGTLLVIDAAREFKELGRSALGESVIASPAFAGGRIFIRGAKHLICLHGSGAPAH
jgi:outer membrane protein assembly factor BamB